MRRNESKRTTAIWRAWGVFGMILCTAQVSAFSFVHGPIQRIQHHVRTPPTLYLAKSAAAQKRLEDSWFPRQITLDDDDIFAEQESTESLEEQSLDLLGTLIRKRLQQLASTNDVTENSIDERITNDPDSRNRAYLLAKGKFLDLTCTEQGERVLERLFDHKEAADEEKDVVLGAIVALQSLCIMGTQVGVKGTPEQLQRMVAHLESPNDPTDTVNVWDAQSVKRLKYKVDQAAGTQLLAVMQRKRSTKGAYDLLVDIGAWEKHENLSLLRSGVPIRFTEEEEEAARQATCITHDPDSLLGIRADFRREKIYTIDGTSTCEIDDGLSVEVLQNADGSTRQRFWMHIADADRWSPRDSNIFKVGERRATSLYLPTGSIPMFPASLSSGVMSLTANADVCALSLGVELHSDGSIDSSSLVMTPSLIRVSYRLTYDEVDEMLEEGVGYREEWQLGAMLAAAAKRRQYRMSNESSEAVVPNPIPQANVATFPDENAPDGIGISLTVEVSHNAGKNRTADAELENSSPNGSSHAAPVSPAFVLVTEMMVLAGEAIGKWAIVNGKDDEIIDGRSRIDHTIKLPFRSQPRPDFQSRARERKIWEDLLESNVGEGYCHAWYARRFFQPVKVSEVVQPHSGLGLDCYVQWTSPIRRFGDLQAHSAVKRFLRRKRINELMKEGKPIPSELSTSDLGCSVPKAKQGCVTDDGRITEYECDSKNIDGDIDFRVGQGFVGAARQLQRKSQQYWMFEYIDRIVRSNSDDAVFEAMVLGCVDPDRSQYAIYLPELGLEHRCLSLKGPLQSGARLRVKVTSVFPSTGLLSLTLA